MGSSQLSAILHPVINRILLSGEKMKNKASKYNWIIDAGLFGGMILMFFLNLTGESLHQWLGIGLGGLAIYHLLRHLGWVNAVAKRFFGKATLKSRLYWLVDVGLLLGFAGILLTGLVISSWLSLTLGNYAAWASLHETLSIATLILVVLKIAVHWRWIIKTTGQIFVRKALPAGRLALQPAAVSIYRQRRDFLQLMGVVSAAAVVALINVKEPARDADAQSTASELPDPQVAQQPLSTTAEPVSTQAPAEQPETSPEAPPAAQPVSLPAAAPTATQAATAPVMVQSTAPVNLPLESSAICIAYCRKGKSCSYPGQCRDYIDTNGNGHCDNGECA
jgi:hypothetical protein